MTKRKRMTDRQKEIYNLIKFFKKRNDCYPTYEELAVLTNTNPANIYNIVKRIVQKGYMKTSRQPRKMMIVR